MMRGMMVAAAGALLLTAACGESGTGSSTVTSPKTSPSPVVNTKVQATAYLGAMLEGAGKIASSTSELQNCGNEDWSCQKTGIGKESAAIKDLRTKLQTMPVPPCLAEFDKDYRAGLDDLSKGVDQLTAAIDKEDVGAMMSGLTLLTEGTNHMNDANAHGEAVDLDTC